MGNQIGGDRVVLNIAVELGDKALDQFGIGRCLGARRHATPRRRGGIPDNRRHSGIDQQGEGEDQFAHCRLRSPTEVPTMRNQG